MHYLAIIGAGPAGYTAAEKAAKAGKSVVLFERASLGGTCLNVGCIPTKALLYSSKQYAHALEATKYGVCVGDVTFDYAKMVSRKQKIVRKLVAGIRMRLKEVEQVVGEATIIDPHTLECNGVRYEAENILVCTGSTNVVPPIPGIDDPRVMDSTTALELTSLPASVAIIGGGVIGMEFATLYHQLGVQVTVIEAAPTILPAIDQEIVAALRTRYEKAGMRILTSTKVENIADIDAERILVCVGRRPVFPAGWRPEYAELPNIYLAGDVTKTVMLAHVAVRQAEAAVNAMLGIADEVRYDAIPAVVYTNPEIATVGSLEGDEVRTLPMSFSGRFVAENEGENGLCKMILREGRIVGVHMLGNPSSEFVSTATMAVTLGLTPDHLSRIIFPHPTVSEILKEMC